jgi:hypothetical protein
MNMCLNYVFRHIIDSDYAKDKKSKALLQNWFSFSFLWPVV